MSTPDHLPNIADRFTPIDDSEWCDLPGANAVAAAAAAMSGNVMSERWRECVGDAIYYDQMIAGESSCHLLMLTSQHGTSATAGAGPPTRLQEGSPSL